MEAPLVPKYIPYTYMDPLGGFRVWAIKELHGLYRVRYRSPPGLRLRACMLHVWGLLGTRYKVSGESASGTKLNLQGLTP